MKMSENLQKLLDTVSNTAPSNLGHIFMKIDAELFFLNLGQEKLLPETVNVIDWCYGAETWHVVNSLKKQRRYGYITAASEIARDFEEVGTVIDELATQANALHNYVGRIASGGAILNNTRKNLHEIWTDSILKSLWMPAALIREKQDIANLVERSLIYSVLTLAGQVPTFKTYLNGFEDEPPMGAGVLAKV
jgi:hypothetical protein